MLKLRQDERGIAALLIALLLVLVSSLIVYGYAEISDNNEHQALTNLLSTEANDAAESGINKGVWLLNNNMAGAANSCSSESQTLTPASINPPTSISCLLIDASPSYLTTPSLYPNTTTTKELNSSMGFNSLTISWQASTTVGPAACGNSPPTLLEYAQYASECNYPILRVELASYTNGGSSTLLNHDITYLLVPSKSVSDSLPSLKVSGGLISYTPSVDNPNQPNNQQTAPEAATCVPNSPVPGGNPMFSASQWCSVTITASSTIASPLYIRITPLYLNTNEVLLTATDSGNYPVSFSNDEAVIDSTGVADNVSSRIIATYQYQCSSGCVGLSDIVPTNAIESEIGLCFDDESYSLNTTYSSFSWDPSCSDYTAFP